MATRAGPEFVAALEARAGRAADGTALYVHLPFCEAKCTYCDFFSVARAGHDIEGMLEAILAEAAWRAPRRPRTLFLGGGTPSLLDEAALARLLDGLDRLADWRAAAVEVSAECNPESLDLEKARALKRLGVTRLSIGFQSLRPALLELFGRVHGVEQSLRAFDAARAAGFEQVNVDLIYAAPGQRLDEWCADLDRVIALGPEHVSAYNLSFEESTPFGRWLEQGVLTGLGEEVELEFFHATRERLAAAGLAPYEISNYARPGRECQHNLNYWRNGAYVGLGPSAASKLGGLRGANVAQIQAYQRRAREGLCALEWSEAPPPRARLAETCWLGLRLAQGLDVREACTQSGCSELDARPILDQIERMQGEGWLEFDGARARLAARGLPLADALARRLLCADGPA